MSNPISPNFILEEFVPKILFDYRAEKSIEMIDMRLVSLVESIRSWFNKPITINDWHKGGKLNDCGYRMPDSKTGATLSQHKFGRAADIHFSGITDYEAIRKEIQDNWIAFKDFGLTTIEAGTSTWLHVDIRYTGIGDLLIVPFR